MGRVRLRPLRVLNLGFDTATSTGKLMLTASAKAAEVATLMAEGHSVRAVAEPLGISVGSVHSILKKAA